MSGRKRRLVGVAVAGLLLAACSNDNKVNNSAPNTNAANNSGSSGNLTFAVISHGGSGDKFWDVVKSGAEKAGTQLGVRVTYQASGGDPQKQSQLIDTAVSEKVSGLVVSMANPDGIKASVQRAVRAGIPVITINSGESRSAEFGAITHIGQSEDVAGQGAGQRLRDDGIKHLLCVVHEAGNIGLEQRCAGAKNAISDTKNLQVDVNNIPDASARIKAKLQSDKSIDGVLTLNNGVAIAARDAIRDSGSSAKLATFDLDATVIDAIKAGQVLFAVDQQPYLQGYLPITLLYLYKTNANVVGGGKPVLTGPGYVTKDNADQVATLAGQGTR